MSDAFHLPLSLEAQARFARMKAPESTWGLDVTFEEEEWLVDRLVPSKAYVGIFGRRASAKSFFGLDLAYKGAHGLPFMGRETERFGSVYCVGEKKARFGKRVEAWKKARWPDGAPRSAAGPDVQFKWSVPNLLDPAEVMAFIDELNALKPLFLARGTPLGAVFLDTLSRSIRGGNVSDAVTAGEALQAIELIIDCTGLTVLPIAHVAKAAAGAETQKGMGEWEDYADALFRIERKDGSATRTVILTKQSDEADAGKWAFELETVTVGVNKRGAPITSCVVREVDDVLDPDARPRAKRPKGPVLSVPAQVVRAALNRMLEDGRAEDVPPFVGVPKWQKGAKLEPLREAAYALDLQGVPPPADCEPKERKAWVDARRKAFERGLDQLRGFQITRQEGGWVWFLP